MNKANIHHKIHYYLAIIIAFSLPLGKLIPVFIILMVLNWLVEGDFKFKFSAIFNNKFALIFISFYLLHIIGLLYTQNKASGLFDLQVKLSLLLFPLILCSKSLSKKETQAVFIAFIIGSIASSLIMLSRSTYLYFAKGENTFFYDSFSVLLHPGYLSMYLNVAISWLLIQFIQNPDKIILKQYYHLFLVLTIVLFSMVIIFLSSKSGILTLFLILISFLLYFIIYKKNHKTGSVVIIGLTLCTIFTLCFSPKTLIRLQSLGEIFTKKTLNNNEVMESTAMRMLIWESANAAIKDNFFIGVGTGDSKEALAKQYEKKNITYALVNKLNAHNEFYQVFISLGVIGFLVLSATLLTPLLSAFKTDDFIYVSFLLIIIFNFLSESMLETQAGVLFYAFFNSLLCFSKPILSNTNNTL
jgi:O-antigen ligase